MSTRAWLPAVRGLGLSLPLALCACPAPPAGPPASDDTEVAAVFEGETITVAELDDRIKEALFAEASGGGNATRLYELRDEKLNEWIDERLVEAAALERGLEPEELLRQESESGVEISEEEVRSFFERNRSRIGERSFEELEASIRTHLAQREASANRQAFVASLREGTQIEVRLEAPRVEVSASGPGRGPEGAPVTIVEFSDYQCPFCKRAEPTVKALLERYPEQVRYVYRHFPLDSIHPRARAASEAAACAEEQGSFWEYHDRLFEAAPAFEAEQLVAYAEEAGLDPERFRVCVEERRFRDRVEADLQAGREAGVSGTPAFFVNGILLSGSRPLDEFVALIERELEREGTGVGSDSS